MAEMTFSCATNKYYRGDTIGPFLVGGINPKQVIPFYTADKKFVFSLNYSTAGWTKWTRIEGMKVVESISVESTGTDIIAGLPWNWASLTYCHFIEMTTPDKIDTGIACTIGSGVGIGGTLTNGAVSTRLISTTPLGIIPSALVEINGTQHTIFEGFYIPVQGGKVGINHIALLGACIDIQADAVPPPLPPPDILPPPPEEPPWDFSSLSSTIQSLFAHIQWYLSFLLNPLQAVWNLLVQIWNWLSHFWDNLDAWVSRLFGIDPAKPFFDELMRKIDVYVSNRFGIDPNLPFLDELVKKAVGWLLSFLDTAADEEKRNRGH